MTDVVIVLKLVAITAIVFDLLVCVAMVVEYAADVAEARKEREWEDAQAAQLVADAEVWLFDRDDEASA